MTTPALKFSTPSKGRRFLVHDDYLYTLNIDRTKIKYWRCQEQNYSTNAPQDVECYFYHSQSIYKKRLKSLDLSNQYKNDEEVRSYATKLN
jgi:hypothetical protein